MSQDVQDHVQGLRVSLKDLKTVNQDLHSSLQNTKRELAKKPSVQPGDLNVLSEFVVVKRRFELESQKSKRSSSLTISSHRNKEFTTKHQPTVRRLDSGARQ